MILGNAGWFINDRKRFHYIKPFPLHERNYIGHKFSMNVVPQLTQISGGKEFKIS